MTLAVLPVPSNHISVPLLASARIPALVLARTTGVVILVVNVGSSFGAFSVSSSLRAVCTSVHAILPAGTFVIFEAV